MNSASWKESESVSPRFTVRLERSFCYSSKLCVCRESRYEAMRVRVAQKEISLQTTEFGTLAVLAVGAVGVGYTRDTQTN
jgi:hypothetical protein